jgi:hypothetical protein
MQWQTKYSSAEMAFLEVGDAEVLYYMDDPSNVEGRWTFEEVLADKADSSLYIPFGPDVLAELKTEVRRQIQPG